MEAEALNTGGVGRVGGNAGKRKMEVERGNVTVEKPESLFNLVCVLLGENMNPPVIGYISTNLVLMGLAALSLHVSRMIFKYHIFSQIAKETGKRCEAMNFHMYRVSVALE